MIVAPAFVGIAEVEPSASMNCESRKPNIEPTIAPARITTMLTWATRPAHGAQRLRSK